MKITIPKEQLVKIVERCDVAADPKATHPHTGKVLLTASVANGQTLRAYCTDLKIQVDTTVEAKVTEPGIAAVDCKRLLAVARMMPSGPVNVDLKKERRLVVSCAGSRVYALPTVEAELFPTASQPDPEAVHLKIEGRILASMISRVQPSVAAEGRPNLEGVFLDYADGVLCAVAVGAHTIGVVRERSVQYEGVWAALLPLPALKSTIALCNETKTVSLIQSGSLVYVKTEDTLVGALLPRDPFVPWRNGVDSLERTRVANVPAIQLREAVQAIMAGRGERTTPISVVIKNEILRVALVGEECKAVDQIVVEALDRPELRVLVRPEYLMEAVRGADATFVLEDTGSSVAVSTDDYFGIVSLVIPDAWPGAFD